MDDNIFNSSGAVRDLRAKLSEKSINRFNSIPEIINFQKNYQQEINDHLDTKAIEIKDDIKNLIEEKDSLLREYAERKSERNLELIAQVERLKAIISNSSKNLILKMKKIFVKIKLNYLKSNFDSILVAPFKKDLGKIEQISNRVEYLQNNQDEELEKRASSFIKKIKFIKSELDSLNPLIYGSMGELKAIKILKKLPDQYYVINDFRKSFNPPIYNSREDDRIYSTQMDHIVVGPTGIYVIETKYWNTKSIKSELFFSPIKQVKRSGFALFVLLNNHIKNASSSPFLTNWGQTKISVFNILLMMKASTQERFQFVKVLTELNFAHYVTKRPVIFNEEQIKYIVNVIQFELNER